MGRMSRADTTRAICITLPKRLVASLEKLADEKRRSRSYFIREVLELYVDTHTRRDTLVSELGGKNG